MNTRSSPSSASPWPAVAARAAALLSALLPACIVWAPVNVGVPPGPAGVAEVVVKEAEGWVVPGKVAIVSVDGVLTGGEEGGLLGGGARNSVSDVVAQLQRARRDDAVRAVVLRIDSPGGSVTASDLIYNEVRRFKQETKRPVIACLMDVAASGGYYVALAADEIWALPTTTTGSIGVVSQLMSVEGLFEKIGLEQRTLKSGALKDAGSPYRPMTDADRQMLQGLVDAAHARFVDVVAEGRSKLPRERVVGLADGRVFTAQEAKDLGLVDGVGYLDQALEAARAAAGLRDAEIISYRVGWGRPANLYATAAEPAPRATLDLGLDRWFPAAGARLLYLWCPGT